MKGFRQRFQEQGLSWAILVWAAAIALMAYHLDGSPWRWAFGALAVGGVATVWGIGWIRRYVDTVTKPALFMGVRDETVETPSETGARRSEGGRQT